MARSKAGAEDDPPVDDAVHSTAVGEAFDRRSRPGAVGGERDEGAEVSRGIERPPNSVEDAGHMPVGIGVVGLLPQDSVKSRFGELVVAEFGKHAAEPGLGLEMVRIELDRRVVPIP